MDVIVQGHYFICQVSFVTSYHPSAIFSGQLSEWAMLI